MNHLSSNPDLRKLVDASLHLGWDVARTASNRLKFLHPSGELIFAPTNPNNSHTVTKLRARLRRAERKPDCSSKAL
jgi:hypothetical protein